MIRAVLNLFFDKAQFQVLKQKSKAHTFFAELIFSMIYILGFCFLNWTKLDPPNHLSVALWNPAAALAVILLLSRGISWAPLVFVASLVSQTLIDYPRVLILSIVCISIGQTVIQSFAVWLFKSRLKLSNSLESLRDAVLFASIFTVSSIAVGIVYGSIGFVDGTATFSEICLIVLQFSTASSLGILLLTSLWFISLPIIKENNLTSLEFKESLYQCGIAISIVLLAFISEQYNFHVFYLFFVPVIWVAVKNGLARVLSVLLVIQVSIVAFLHLLKLTSTLSAGFLPFFTLTLTWTALILGTVIDEQGRIKLFAIKSDARLKAVLEMLPDCILIVDFRGHIVTCNKAFLSLYESTNLSKLIDMRIENLIPTFYAELTGETFLVLTHGRKIPIEVASNKVQVGDKFSSILTIRNISSRKEAEIQIRKRRAATEQTTRSNLTGGLAAALAHELNQPLSAIMTYASACTTIVKAQEHPPQDVLTQLSKVIVQAQRAGHIIKRLRDFFQNSNIEKSRVNILELVNEAFMLLEDEIFHTQADVKANCSEDLFAHIDRIQVEQVLINLIKNSLEALKEVSPRLRRIIVSAEISMCGDIEIIVADTGMGIAAEIADQLFSPFRTTRSTGMGLGLAISRSIIEAHNGRLWAEPLLPTGAALHFTVPVFGEQ